MPILLALALQAASPSSALPTGVGADARCIVVFGYVGARGTPEQATAMRQGIFYYLGKLRGRDPSLDIGATVARASDAAKSAALDAGAEVRRCSAEVESAGASLRRTRDAPGKAPAPSPRKR